jgi:hypothetical protein
MEASGAKEAIDHMVYHNAYRLFFHRLAPDALEIWLISI